MATAEPKQEVIWEPEPRQAEFLAATEDEVLFGGAAGGGKLLSVDSPVLTPMCWRRIGDLKVGSKVCATDGTITEVIGVYPQGEQDLYWVEFEDGGKVEAGLEHLWLAWRTHKSRKVGGVRTSGAASARKYTTANLIAAMSKSRGKRRIGMCVPVTSPVAMNVAGELIGPGNFVKRPVDPYLLGLLLGDGSIGSKAISITSADAEIMGTLAGVAGADVAFDKSHSKAFQCRFRGEFLSRLKSDMRALRLLGSRSHTKFIPRQYLWAPVPDRWSLLQGLMDTDGWVEPSRCCYYCTTSKKLAEDVAHLARSLGAIVGCTEKSPSFTSNGIKKRGRLAYALRIKMDRPERLFRLGRKIAIAEKLNYQSLGRRIENIRFSRRSEAVCIQVAHCNSLYITADFIVTHNSDSIVVDALGLQHEAVKNPAYRALLLRRSFKELKEIIDRTRTIYPKVYPGTEYHVQDSEWRFPSGARIELSYLDNDTDVMRYQSRQFQWIGWEEIAQWPTEYPYEYMISRLRAPVRVGLPLYIRATCNPDGPGARWLAKRFGISPAGEASTVTLDIGGRQWRRRFIPSRLSDNRHLAGTGYREKLMMLPDDIRRALLEGRWDEPTVHGAIYAREMAEMADGGRIRPIPYDPRYPVHTVWDLGWNDAMSIIMVQKPHPSALNVINYIEDSFRRYDQYVEEFAAMPYHWGHDWLPHDGGSKNPQTGMSAYDTLKKLGRKVKQPLPRLDPEVGIRQARMMFPRVYIDNTERKRLTGYAGAARRGDCLRHYRRTIPKSTNEPAVPLHDSVSHGADAFRLLAAVADQIRNDGDEEVFPSLPSFHNPERSMGLLGG